MRALERTLRGANYAEQKERFDNLAPKARFTNAGTRTSAVLERIPASYRRRTPVTLTALKGTTQMWYRYNASVLLLASVMTSPCAAQAAGVSLSIGAMFAVPEWLPVLLFSQQKYTHNLCGYFVLKHIAENRSSGIPCVHAINFEGRCGGTVCSAIMSAWNTLGESKSKDIRASTFSCCAPSLIITEVPTTPRS